MCVDVCARVCAGWKEGLAEAQTQPTEAELRVRRNSNCNSVCAEVWPKRRLDRTRGRVVTVHVRRRLRACVRAGRKEGLAEG